MKNEIPHFDTILERLTALNECVLFRRDDIAAGEALNSVQCNAYLSALFICLFYTNAKKNKSSFC